MMILRRTMIYLVIFFTCCFVLVTGAKAQPVVKFWAMDVGNYWTYGGTSDPYGGSWTWRNDVAARDTTTCPVTTYRWEGKENSGPVWEKSWFEISATNLKLWRFEIYDDVGLRWIKVILDSGYTTAKNPLIVLDTWTEYPTGTVMVGANTYNNQSMTSTVTVKSYANLTVPLGTYKAYKVEVVLSVPGLGLTRTQNLWMVPYLGLLRIDSVETNETEIETLTSMKIKKWISDYVGSGNTDVSAFHLPSDQFFVDSTGNLGQYGWSDSMPLAWDYNGDGITDVSVYHIPTNQWFAKGFPGNNMGQFGWGGEESIPVPGDYDGDGVMERAFYHSPTNRWFVEGQAPVDFGWGGADCIPIAADYDGDGTTDMMLYHIPSNQWFVYGIGNLGQFGWNGSECIPVPGDWDGDGKTEIGIYHWPSNQWFWRNQDGTTHFLGQYGWGGMASFPIPGDYNGDGIMERAFYRPSENRWFIEGEADFVWGWGGTEFMPITSQMAIYNWFRFVLGRFQ